MAIDYSGFAIPKPPTRFSEKKQRRAGEAAHYREVCAATTQRDGSCCRVCKKWCNPRAISMLEKLHHHHIIPTSLGGLDETWNLMCLCADCHDDEHGARIQLSGNADERDEMGRLAGVKLERMTESGWRIEGFV